MRTVQSRFILCLLFILYFVTSIQAKQPSNQYLCPSLVDRFYILNNQQLFWFNTAYSPNMLYQFIALLDSADQKGLNKEKYHYREIKTSTPPADSAGTRYLDRLYTDALIAFARDVLYGVRQPETGEQGSSRQGGHQVAPVFYLVLPGCTVSLLECAARYRGKRTAAPHEAQPRNDGTREYATCY